jgi:hypothetical protein
MTLLYSKGRVSTLALLFGSWLSDLADVPHSVVNVEGIEAQIQTNVAVHPSGATAKTGCEDTVYPSGQTAFPGNYGVSF